MTSLTSCYFCGAAVGASLEEHSVPADAPAGDQITLTLCSSCAGKLDQLFEQLPLASSRSTASDDAPAPSELDVDPEIPGSDPEPIFADDEGTLLGTEDDEERSAPTDPGSDVALDDGADDAGSDSSVSGSAPSDAPAPASTAPDDGASVADSASEASTRADGDDEVDRDVDADVGGDDARSDDARRDDSRDDARPDDSPEPDGPAPGGESPAQAEAASGADEAPASGSSPNSASPEQSPVAAPSSEPARSSSQQSAESDSNARATAAGDAPDETRTERDADRATGDEPSEDVSTRTYNRVVRLLQNREFPVDRTEFETLATSAYELELGQVEAALDVAVEKGLLDEHDGHLHRPE